MSRTTASSYWCYRCTRFVRVSVDENVVCPYCDGGFVEAIDVDGNTPLHNESRRRFSNGAMYMLGNERSDLRSRQRSSSRHRNNNGDRSPFNPVIVLRGGGGSGDGGGGGGDEDSGGGERGFELYYDDGAGSGLQPLPSTMSEFLMGSGFDRLLDQLSQIEINGLGRSEHPPASKAAVESLPTIEINEGHVSTESHCAVCKEAFILGSEAKEMPCKHIYHTDCILPWLSIRNSCPHCRHELPIDSSSSLNNSVAVSNEEEAVGLTIWRLPGGGFAVGRFTGGRRGGNGERELPVVYTEMDGGFNNSGTPRRITWGSRRSRASEGGIGRVFRNMFSFLGRRNTNSRNGSHSSSLSSASMMSRSRSLSSSVFSRITGRRGRTWVLEEQNGMSRW